MDNGSIPETLQPSAESSQEYQADVNCKVVHLLKTALQEQGIPIVEISNLNGKSYDATYLGSDDILWWQLDDNTLLRKSPNDYPDRIIELFKMLHFLREGYFLKPVGIHVSKDANLHLVVKKPSGEPHVKWLRREHSLNTDRGLNKMIFTYFEDLKDEGFIYNVPEDSVFVNLYVDKSSCTFTDVDNLQFSDEFTTLERANKSVKCESSIKGHRVWNSGNRFQDCKFTMQDVWDKLDQLPDVKSLYTVVKKMY